MTRLIAGSVAALLLMSGVFLFFTSKAAETPLPQAPRAGNVAPLVGTTTPSLAAVRSPPLASAKSREEKRFARADKDEDGRITSAELFEPRRKAFAKLDTDGNGTLSFEEWAVKTVDKFAAADADRSGWLTPAEYASTAPKPVQRKAICSC